MPIRGATRVIFVALLLGCLGSCAGGDPANTPTGKKLQAIAKLYLEQNVSSNGKEPTNEAAFKKFVRNAPEITFSANNIAIPATRDELFVSDRDKSAFAIVYSLSLSGMSKKSAPIVAHETVGLNGKHIVVFLNSDVEEVTSERLKELLENPPQ